MCSWLDLPLPVRSRLCRSRRDHGVYPLSRRNVSADGEPGILLALPTRDRVFHRRCGADNLRPGLFLLGIRPRTVHLV